MIGRLRAVAWQLIADSRRVVTRSGNARSALRSFGGPSRRSSSAWAAATMDAHDAYRAAHPVAAGTIAAVCVSMRPELLPAVVDNVSRQSHRPDHVVFVTNVSGFDSRAVHSAWGDVARVSVIDGVGWSLGAALNLALSATDARFVAKFDDDDLYGPNYLADALRAHAYAGAGVVGKHTYYAYLSAADETVLRFPTNEFRYSSTLAGGTLVIDRERVGDLAFADVSIGEDRDFIARCHRAGISTFSADRFNFLQVRSGDNTWTVSDVGFRRNTSHVATGMARSVIER